MICSIFPQMKWVKIYLHNVFFKKKIHIESNFFYECEWKGFNSRPFFVVYKVVPLTFQIFKIGQWTPLHSWDKGLFLHDVEKLELNISCCFILHFDLKKLIWVFFTHFTHWKKTTTKLLSSKFQSRNVIIAAVQLASGYTGP